MGNMISDATIETIKKNAAYYDRFAKLPSRSIAALNDARLLRLAVPQPYGGWGLGLREAADVVEKVSGACSSTGLLLAMHYIYTFKVYTDSYSEDVKKAVSESCKDGKLLNTFGVEPEMGSIHRGGLPATAITRVDNKWILNGKKIYCSGSYALGWYMVRVNVIDSDATPRTTFVLVDADSKGITIKENWETSSMRATESHDIEFDNVEVPDGCVGDMIVMSNPKPLLHGPWNDILLASMYLGIAKEAQVWFRDFLQNRKPTALNAALATVPRLQDQMGMMDMLTTRCRLVIDRGIDLYESKKLDGIVVNHIKTMVSEDAISAVEIAVKCSGNHAINSHNPIDRLWRDIQTARINMPQPDLIYNRAGKKYLNV